MIFANYLDQDEAPQLLFIHSVNSVNYIYFKRKKRKEKIIELMQRVHVQNLFPTLKAEGWAFGCNGSP